MVGSGNPQEGDIDGRERGSAIHAMLEWLTDTGAGAGDKLPEELATRLGRAAENSELQAWWQEALHTLRDPALAHLFDDRQYQKAMNEVPVQYLENGRTVYGIIDRVIIRDDTVLVIDYKTHRSKDSVRLNALAKDYAGQMQLYGQAAAWLWPPHSISTRLLFTHSATLVTVDGSPG